jgi:hypothetical protein
VTALGISPYADLEPPVWRNLLSRAAVFHALRAHLAALSEAADRVEVVKLVLLRLDLAARRVSREVADDAAAVERVAGLCGDAIEEGMASATDEPDAHGLLSECRELVRAACENDPFGAMFEGIQAHASDLYGDAWRPTDLAVAHVRRNPWRGPRSASYPLTAVTAWPAPERAVVELRIFCEGFGPAAYASVPILLTHECVAHVPARQECVKNDSEFAEGFMDWAAYHFLDTWAAKLDRELAPAARKHAARLKYVLVDDGDGRPVRARLLGHRAAENLLVWLEGEWGLSSAESRTRVALLAVELNQVECELALKDRFVSMLGWGAFPPPVAAALCAWMSGRLTAAALLEEAAADD